jgi:hypothetical protein
VRLGLARLLAQRAEPAPFPRAPFEPTLDAIRWARGERIAWPGRARCALLLTHDVDTSRGASLIASVAELERALGVRSAFLVCSHHYALDLDLLARLEQEGFELASHGWNHDNRLAFLPAPERAARLDAIAARFRPRFALAGFRSPSTLRTPELLADSRPGPRSSSGSAAWAGWPPRCCTPSRSSAGIPSSCGATRTGWRASHPTSGA